MPPKAAPEPPPPKVMQISVKVHHEGSEKPEKDDFFVRIISEWATCLSSDKLGFGDLLWVDNPDDPSQRSTTVAAEFDPVLPNIDAIKQFNIRPGIFAFLMKRINVEGGTSTIIPVAFTYQDCSSMLLEKTTLTSSSELTGGFRLTTTISTIKPLYSSDDLLTLEPIIFQVDRIFGFPMVDDDTIEILENECFVFCRMGLGMGLDRNVFVRPSAVETEFADLAGTAESKQEAMETADSDSDNEIDMDLRRTIPRELPRQTLKLGLKLCILPGCTDIENFKEMVTSSTYEFEIYRDNLTQRAISNSVIREYNTLFASEGVAAVAAAAAPPAKGGKGAPAPAAIASTTPPTAKPPGPITESDKFLLRSVFTALETSRQIVTRGSSRYRLEGLLSQSQDLLKEFSRLRKKHLENIENIESKENPDDNTVVIEESMTLEVRLEKPCKPTRWTRPEEMSLIRALEDDIKELEFDPGRTNEENIMSLTRNRIVKPRVRPWYERLLDCSTHLTMTAELLRSYQHPLPLPPVMASTTMALSKSLTQSLSNTMVNSEDEQRLRRRLAVTPFARMVFVFKYDNDELLEAINKSMTAVNASALPDIQGSIRSYSYTDEELQACKKGQLDVISGFTVIDDDYRLVVLEGLAGPGQGMQKVFMDLPRVRENDYTLKILSNPDTLFPQRLYGDFGPDLKRIRLREKIKKLSRRPELYNRKQVDEICFMSIDKVMALRRSEDLQSTKDFDLFPSYDSLVTLELLYGEAVSRSDIDGIRIENARKEAEQRRKREIKAIADGKDPNEETATLSQTQVSQTQLQATETLGTSFDANGSTKHRTSRLAATDCHNPEFEATLRNRPEHRVDYLAEQRALRQQAWEDALKRTQSRMDRERLVVTKILGDTQGDNNPHRVYVYSQQTLNFKAKAMAEMRERLSKVKNATFTYSQDFVSQTLTLVSDDNDRLAAQQQVKSHWLTPSGFRYPKPKTRKELIEHPKKPSQARIEDLREPWDGDMRSTNNTMGMDPNTLKLEQGYIVRFRSGEDFGKLEPSKFEREFQLRLVGDRSKLPRGKMVSGHEKDPAFFKSVHLGGEGQARLLAEAKEAEKKEWADKVVVDHLDFKVGGFKIRDRPMQCDRTSDILKDDPKRLALKQLRSMKLPSGKEVPYETAPLSILTGETYVDNQQTEVLLRKENPKHFITVKDSIRLGINEDKPKDFVRYINKYSSAPKVVSMVAKRSHPPLPHDSDERRGPKWGQTTSNM